MARCGVRSCSLLLFALAVLANVYLLVQLFDVERRLHSFHCPHTDAAPSALDRKLAALRAASLQAHLLTELLADADADADAQRSELDDALQLDSRRDARNFLVWFNVQLQKQYAELAESDGGLAAAELEQAIAERVAEPDAVDAAEWAAFLRAMFTGVGASLQDTAQRVERNEALVPSIRRGMSVANNLLNRLQQRVGRK